MAHDLHTVGDIKAVIGSTGVIYGCDGRTIEIGASPRSLTITRREKDGNEDVRTVTFDDLFDTLEE